MNPGAVIVGGDVITGDGTTHGCSIYGRQFPDESYDILFTHEGDLAYSAKKCIVRRIF